MARLESERRREALRGGPESYPSDEDHPGIEAEVDTGDDVATEG
jgi:hypothetical protein